MFVAPDGTAYVGDMGFDIHEFGRLMAAGDAAQANALFRPAPVYAVAPDGAVRVAASDCAFSNGIGGGPGPGQGLVDVSLALTLPMFPHADRRRHVDPMLFHNVHVAQERLP